jgi:hypothetical protein
VLLITGASLFGQSAITVQGVLLKANGKPRVYTEIELVPLGAKKVINDPRLVSTSDSRGYFHFNDVPSGGYTLSINFDDKPSELSPYGTYFYPLSFAREDAEVLTIDKATRLRNIVFRLPPELTPSTIAGRVLWENGAPVKDAIIGFWDLRIQTSAAGADSAIRTDADGRFKVLGFVGRKYQLGALAFDHIPRNLSDREGRLIGVGESEPFVVGAENNVEIRVKSPTAGEDFWKKYIFIG